MNILRLGVAVLPFFALTGAANAQIGSGRSGISTADRLENVNAFSELNTFGRCIAGSSRSRAFSLLATTPGSREESALFNRHVFGQNSCLGSGTDMTLSIVYVRGVIAEALFEARAPVPANLVQTAPAPAEVRDLGGVARCYTAGHRSEVQALLSTRAGSAEELAAVSALWNNFRACMPEGFRVRLNAQWIRFLLAEAMLRLAPAAPTPS